MNSTVLGCMRVNTSPLSRIIAAGTDSHKGLTFVVTIVVREPNYGLRDEAE